MKEVAKIAKAMIDQWENHDRHRVIEGEKSLFANGKEPDDVCVAKAFLTCITLLKRELPNQSWD